MIISDETGQFITDERAARTQRLRRALLTPVGSMPGNPTYGSNLHRLLGRPAGTQRLGEIAQEITAVARRILTVDGITINPTGDRTVLVTINNTLQLEL